MPDYLAPGVYVEDTSFHPKSIEGVSTTTAGFIGPSRYGPVDSKPDIITSLGEFEKVYGDRQQLKYGNMLQHNFLWHAARAFFEEGGKRLYASRVFKPLAGTYPPADFAAVKQTFTGSNDDGHARAAVPSAGGDNSISLRARFPGSAGNMMVRFTVRLGQNILGGTKGETAAGALASDDVVWIGYAASPTSSASGTGNFYLTEYDSNEQTWRFKTAKSKTSSDLRLKHSNPSLSLARRHGIQIRVVTLTLTVLQNDGPTIVWDGISPDPDHKRDGAADSLKAKFGDALGDIALKRTLPIVITPGNGLTNGLALINSLIKAKAGLATKLNDLRSSDEERSIDVQLTGGNDGVRPTADEYKGKNEEGADNKTGLAAFEDIEDISIVAAPGATFGYENSYSSDASTIVNLLIAHASHMRYRIAVLDSGDSQTISQVRAMRAKLDSTFAALYYPWVRILDPVTGQEIHLPPSGFVAGIYARNDIERGVYKSPANEVVRMAIGFETIINKSQQDVLNPEGINCFRYFEGRGYRLWGARTVSSDTEWKYVNIRRYFAYLERSIDKGTQWAVFEPKGEPLWVKVRGTIEDFLFNEYKSGALPGDKPEQAYFVRCDRSTMTQSDLDNGRLICLIGVAPVRPAEFIIFRIGQCTAEQKI